MSGRNIFGYFVGILLFLIIIPGAMYGVAVNFVMPINLLVCCVLGGGVGSIGHGFYDLVKC